MLEFARNPGPLLKDVLMGSEVRRVWQPHSRSCPLETVDLSGEESWVESAVGPRYFAAAWSYPLVGSFSSKAHACLTLPTRTNYPQPQYFKDTVSKM